MRFSNPADVYTVCICDEAVNRKITTIVKYDTELDNFQPWISDNIHYMQIKCFIAKNKLIIVLRHRTFPYHYFLQFCDVDTGNITELPTIKCRLKRPSIDYYNNELYFIGMNQWRILCCHPYSNC